MRNTSPSPRLMPILQYGPKEAGGMCERMVSPGWLLPLLLIAGPRMSWPEVPAMELALPVLPTVAASDQHLRGVRDSGKGYLIDLATGNGGTAFRTVPAPRLSTGRYRVHVLVGAGPPGNDIVDPVELTLSAGDQNRHVSPREIPKTGDLAEIWLDFAVAQEGVTTVSLKWFVGDSLLNVPDQEKARARQNLLNRRAAAILQEGQSLSEHDDVEAALKDEEKVPLIAIGETPSPRFRLVITGMTIEALCPVGIERVQTDKAAYEPGEKARLEVTARNFSKTDVPVTLTAELTSADTEATAPGAECRAAALIVPAARALTHKFPDPFPTGGMQGMARISARISWQETRPATSDALFAVTPPRRVPRDTKKKIFAHYMGCWPIGTGALFYQRQTEGKGLRHEASGADAYRYGGHVRNFDLVDPSRALSPEESADLEIRRAIRIGIDGFAVDAWAGDQGAHTTLDTLFQVAEAKDYPFELTVCIDPACGGNNVETVRDVLAKHGKSPKLARRDGRPLFFGYMSVWTGYGHLMKYAPDRVEAMRAQPIGWHILGQSLADAARQVGQPVYWHYCLSAFFHNVDPKWIDENPLTQAASVLGRYADAIGGFTWLGPQQIEIGKAVRASGAEWSMPVGMYQKENIPFEAYIPKGTDWMHWGKAAREQDATLLQIITWNDYGENSNIAPAYNTRYTLYDLTGYEIGLWKTGAEPAADHDRVYLIYRKYPPSAKIFPFQVRFPGVEPGVIEVLTILPKPATIRLPGRQVEFDAPAGFHRQQFPVTAGPMVAELVRDGKTTLRLEGPEPITDRPFREDNGLVCWSSEEDRLWKEDFGDAPPFWYSEYGDLDKDGLPNWFEMYWFSKERRFQPEQTDEQELEGEAHIRHSRWLDFTTAGFADPKADPDGDGKTNLEEYLGQTDPTMAPAPGKTGGGGHSEPNDPLKPTTE